MPSQRLTLLFEKYFDKTATPEERDELMGLFRDVESDQGILDLMEKTYLTHTPGKNPFVLGRREKMLEQIQIGITREAEQGPVKGSQLKVKILKYAVAASILICLGIFSYLFFNKQINRTQLAKTDFRPGGNKAVLTLSNGSTIILNDARNGTLANQGGTSVSKTQAGEIAYDDSGSNNSEDSDKPTYNTINTPKGGQFQVVLSDGSKVWLNSYSSLKFPTSFTDKQRVVEITGEVYFEVAKDKTKPFLVKAGNQIVEVLGTHFNINSYADEPDIKTTLLEGAVKIKQLNTGFSALLKPGQQAVNNSSGKLIVQQADIEQAVAWKYGLFQINDANIETIMRQAARWYDVDIIYEGKVPQRKFSGKIKRDVKASEFLEMLAFFNVNFSMEGRKIIVKKE